MSALGRWWLLSRCALAFLLQFEVPLAIACLLVLLLGALMGTLAGVLRGVFNVPSFVATLGLWSALRGMGAVYDQRPCQCRLTKTRYWTGWVDNFSECRYPR